MTVYFQNKDKRLQLRDIEVATILRGCLWDCLTSNCDLQRSTYHNEGRRVRNFGDEKNLLPDLSILS